MGTTPRKHSLTLALIGICLAFPTAHANTNHGTAECITHFIQDSSDGIDESDITGFVRKFVDRDLLIQNPIFNEFLRAKKVTWSALTPDQQSSTIAEYLRKNVLSTYQGEKLRLLQSESLQEILKFHGILATASNARKKLERISQRNVARILKGKDTAPTPETQKLLDKIPKISVYYIHNTNELNEAPKLPLLSSRQLEKLGIMRGVNSNYEYNRSFLRSDDSVFFYALPARSPSEASKKTSYAYGAKSISLDPNYANDTGIISLFNMYPGSLAKGKHLSSPQAKTFVGNRMPWRGVENDPMDPATLKKWERARSRLYRLDFTPQDFEDMTQKLLIVSLNRLSVEDPTKFNQISWDLTNQSGNANELLTELIFKMNGMDQDFEMKIPVAVPASATRLLDQSNLFNP